ncbi:carbohydrate-binding family 9-like protein [Agriterribacter sp.]|uniref:carbohydrate-binding family 9-like protein n=1 Tax=Agriterribacter sp. TaxID=2821509 RepID=UPI002B9E8048|nr:carbohydrate-binding family 9-like protein [Agriterribacter sp.]HRP57902.1 carbohydrate-binding family 9-like protein [Agriterribacter sp.]
MKLSGKIAFRSNRFTDIISGAATCLDTRAAVLWDDQYLYVGYWIEEPFVTATHTQRDALIYQDNDVELFIAGRIIKSFCPHFLLGLICGLANR